MNYKEKLQVLEEAGVDIPSKKVGDVNKAYREYMEGKETVEDVEVVTPDVMGTRTYTYVGAGESSPSVIKFMGKIDMVRGTPIEIPELYDNMKIHAKLKECPTIVEGRVSLEELQERDVAAKNEADEQRKKDLEVNQKAQRALGR